MNSEIAKRICIAVQKGIIKSRVHFWKSFSAPEKINALNIDASKYEFECDIVCCFDEDFPRVPVTVKSADKPFLFAFRGDIGLLNDAAKNVAVVGVLGPDASIIERERRIIRGLVGNGRTVVSGLALGVDTVAHEETLLNAGKTVAFLPSTLESVFPHANEVLANNIVAANGLLVTEYIEEATDKYGKIKRFIERDRLQAMFVKSIILIASYQKDGGDSGSRHAMQKAKEYGAARFVMFDKNSDGDKPIFGLNAALLNDGAEVLTAKTLCLL